MITGAVVLAPALSFLSVVAAAIILGTLRGVGVPAILALAAAGIAGRLVRKQRVPWAGVASVLPAP